MSTLFVSDLHLDASAPAVGDQFRAFLERQASSAEALYILGDLFESWVGDDDQEPYREQICSALARLTALGVPSYVMHGNRDFLLGGDFAARTGVRLIADPLRIELYGEPALITHGDALCTGDHAYQRLRSVVRRPSWQRRFRSLPLPLRQALAERAREGSRRHVRDTAEYIMDADPRAVLAVMRACGVHTLVHGHTHRPAVHALELDGASARRIVLGAWHERGSYLRWDASGFSLEELPR